MPGAGHTGEQGTGGLCPLGTESNGRVRQTQEAHWAISPLPFPQEDILSTLLERGPWHPWETASGDEPGPSPPGGLRGSPTHLPIRDDGTLVTDHSPNLAALGAGVEVARGLLLWQLLHRALHSHLLRMALATWRSKPLTLPRPQAHSRLLFSQCLTTLGCHQTS